VRDEIDLLRRLDVRKDPLDNGIGVVLWDELDDWHGRSLLSAPGHQHLRSAFYPGAGEEHQGPRADPEPLHLLTAAIEKRLRPGYAEMLLHPCTPEQWDMHATDIDLNGKDIGELTSPDAFTAFLTRLGYCTSGRTYLTPESIGLAGEGAAAFRKIELLS